MNTDPHAVHIMVDGSCLMHEGRKAGYAGLVMYPDNAATQEIIFAGFRESTINRMELAAVIAAIDWIREEEIGERFQRVQILSDSQYVVEGQARAAYWRQAKWRSSAGRPIENHDLWRTFLTTRANARVRVDICKVRNKSTTALKFVDQRAKAAAKNHTRLDRGLSVGKLARAIIKGSPTLYPAANQVVVIRIVRSKTVGPSHENKFVFEVLDEHAKTYTAKHYAYCTPATGAQLHRQRGFRVQMNADKRYPQILQVLEEVPLPSSTRA